jgi:hypothetical protein
MLFAELKKFFFPKPEAPHRLGISVSYLSIAPHLIEMVQAGGTEQEKAVMLPGAKYLRLQWGGRDLQIICEPRNRGIPKPSAN